VSEPVDPGRRDAAAGASDAELPPMTGLPLAVMTLALSFATFMEVLDITIANVSIPHIAGDLGASATQATWVITAYGVANAITVLLAGWLARRFGEVRVFTSCSLGFALASLLCGFASSLPMLVALRVLQGAVAGPMVTMSQSLLMRNWAPEKRGVAMAFWGMTTVVAPLLGPILGGWITDNWTWPWIFYINVPFGLVATAVTWRTLQRRETPRTRDPVDYTGFALVVLGVGALQIFLDKGKELDWFESPLIVVLALVAAVALVALLIWELGEERPIVDFRLFKRRNFAVAVAVMALGYAAMFSNIVLMPLYLQTQLGYTATWAGLVIAPVGIFSIMLMPVVGRNVARLNIRLLVTFAALVFAAAALWRSTFTSGADYAYLAMPQLIQGIGVACFFTPLIALYTTGMPPSLFASSSSLMNFTRMVAGTFATSLVTTVWDRREAVHQTHLVERLTSTSPALQQGLAQLDAQGLGTTEAAAQVARGVAQQAYILAANEIFFWTAIVFFVLVGVVWLARPVHATGPVSAH
jgi:DHA2 family multidrug resistance protein